jgi:hypothetical protein
MADKKMHKDACAVSLGSRGGNVGGPARALALPGSLRSKIAKKAADSRWGHKTPTKKGDYKKLAGAMKPSAQRTEKKREEEAAAQS